MRSSSGGALEGVEESSTETTVLSDFKGIFPKSTTNDRTTTTINNSNTTTTSDDDNYK
jgi:hypothetical protein